MAPKRQLYITLGVAQDATESDISRAYRRLALQYHPDRNPEGEQKFKEIANAYGVLSDTDKRRVYDATGVLPGNVEESEVTEAQRSAEVKEQVQAFYSNYAGSAEEEEDLQKCYKKCKGNFRRMVREELLFDNGKEGEVARLLALVKSLIASGKLQSMEAWEVTSTSAAVRKIERAMTKERKEAAEALKEMGLPHTEGAGNGMQSLQALIRRDQEAEWGNMMSNLEAKYLTPKKQDKAVRKKPAAAHQEEPKRKKRHVQK